MTQQFYIPTESVTTDISIRKSHFVSTVFPVQSRDQAKAIIQEQRSKHPKANHVVWAYCVNTHCRQDVGMSDDADVEKQLVDCTNGTITISHGGASTGSKR